MADTKIFDLPQNTGVASNDRVPHVDVSDTTSGTHGANGTTKYATVSDLLAGVYIAGGTDVAVTDGGTGSSTASGARTNLGLGTIATVDSPVPIANGGTNATSASAARTSLGLVISTDVQAWDADLDALAALTSGANLFPYYTGTNAMATATFIPWTTYTPTWANTTLGNGTRLGRYTQIGKAVHFVASFQLGSTSAMSTGPTCTLPVTATALTNYGGESGNRWGGSVSITDDSANVTYYGSFDYTSTTIATCRIFSIVSAQVTRAGISSTVPMTWATSDEIIIRGTYEAA
jgi:hypothetical protein